MRIAVFILLLYTSCVCLWCRLEF